MKNINYSITLILLFFFVVSVNAQWQSCGNYSGNVLSFAVMDSVLIAGTYGNGAYYTTDGINWTYSTAGMTNTRIISMVKSGNVVFAGSESGGVYRSTDAGINWTPVNNGLTSIEIHTICTNAGKVYAGTNTGLFMSSDNGANWALISTSNVGSIIFASLAYDDKIIATSSSGVFITSNGGANWNSITSGTGGSIYCLTGFNGTVYAGSSSQGVFKTTNSGVNWTQLNSGFPVGKAVRGIYCESEKIYIAVYNSGGVYFLPSTGSSWIAANQGLTQLSSYNVVVFKNDLYAGTLSGIFKRPKSEFSLIKKTNENVTDEFKLLNNYPNPFNSQTIIKFSIPFGLGNNPVKLELFDISGRTVETLVNSVLTSGEYAINFNAENLASGCYFLKLTGSNQTKINKITLLK